MRVKLYKPFEHWYHGGSIFLYSDPHFNDPESKLMNPNWPDADEVVKSINSCLSKNDTIIFLGDIGDESFVKNIKGYKVLLLGNHDKGVSNYEKKWYISVTKEDKFDRAFDSLNEANEYISEMKADGIDTQCLRVISNRLFDEVYEGSLFINEKICLSHEPIYLDFGINIHGHVHLGEQSIYRTNDWARINVCSDVRNWKPVRLDKLTEEFKVTTLHRQTIDKASNKTKKER